MRIKLLSMPRSISCGVLVATLMCIKPMDCNADESQPEAKTAASQSDLAIRKTLLDLLDVIASLRKGMKAASLYDEFKSMSAFHEPFTGAYVFGWKRCMLLRIKVHFVGVEGDRWTSVVDKDWRIERVSAPYVEPLPVD